MNLIKDFLATRIKKNCAWYAIPISILFTWRYTHVRHIPFSSTASARLYFVFLALTYIVLMVVFFIMFAMANNQTKH